VIIAHVVGSKSQASVIATPDSSLVSTGAAKSLDKDETEGDTQEMPMGNNNLGCGKRKITKNKQYALFW
jgi:hypothetical protein